MRVRRVREVPAAREGEAVSYTRDGDRVTLTLSVDDWDALLIAVASTPVMGLWRKTELANRLNEGNPAWTPYEIPTTS